MHAVTALTIDGTFNARVLHDAAGEPWLYRSAALDALTTNGLVQLAEHGVALVLDLREDGERADARHDLPVEHVPLYRSPDGPPQTGTLDDVYRDLVTRRGDELARAVGVVARAPGPVLVHCAVGKDRTGLVVALALRAAGVPLEAVLADYARSAPEVTIHRADAVAARLASLGLDAADRRAATRLHLESPPEVLARALAHVDERGGVPRYLLDHGLDHPDLARLRERGTAR